MPSQPKAQKTFKSRKRFLHWLLNHNNHQLLRSSIQIDETLRPPGHCMMQIFIFANFLGLNKKGSKHSAKMAMNAI